MPNLRFISLSAQDVIPAGDTAFQLSIETPEGWRNIELGVLQQFFTDALMHRVEVLEDSVLKEAAPWPYARRLTLTGQASGFVDIDGTQDVFLTVTIPDGALQPAAVDGLVSTLLGLRVDLDDDTSRIVALETGLATKLDKTATAVAAEKLATPRLINGVAFDGTQNITVSGDAHYTHDQTVPATEWTVTHNLNKRPSVSVQDSAGTDVVGAVSYIDMNSLKIEFIGAMSGQAHLN